MVNWYALNGLKANPGKFQSMILGNKNHDFVFKIGDVVIDEKDSIDLLGVNLDNKLSLPKQYLQHVRRYSIKYKLLSDSDISSVAQLKCSSTRLLLYHTSNTVI